MKTTMKKDRFTILLAAAAMLAACSSNDTFKEVDTPDVVIGFNGQYVEKPTKAEITDSWLTTDGSDFGVYGYRYAIGNTDPTPFTLFNNERVYYVTSPADWLHTTVRYWDKGATGQYYFYAYAPYSATAASFNRAANGGLTYTMPVDGNSKTQVFVDTDNALDLCIAAVEETDYEHCSTPAHVHFTFSHALSKLSFKVKKEGFGANDVVRLTSITFAAPISTTATWSQNALTGVASANVAYTGYAAPASLTDNVKTAFTDSGADTPDNPATPDTDESAVVGVEDIIAGTTAGDDKIGGSKSFIVIPNTNPANPNNVQDGEKHLIKLTVEYELEYGDNHQKESHTAYGDVRILYQSGNHYIVTINIKPVAIEFHVDAITDFTTVNAGTFDVQ